MEGGGWFDRLQYMNMDRREGQERLLFDSASKEAGFPDEDVDEMASRLTSWVKFEQGGGGALAACQAVAIHEEVVERGPDGAEKAVHVLEKPGVCDAAAGERRCGAVQHGNASEEALPSNDQMAPQAAMRGVLGRQ